MFMPPQVLPLLLMFVMFGPVLLTGLIYAFDIVANSEFAVKIGMTDDPRTRLTKFYTKHNPTKMRDVSYLGPLLTLAFFFSRIFSKIRT